MVLPSSIHYDEIVHNNEDLMVARIICYTAIRTYDRIYCVFHTTNYVLVKFYHR